MITVERASSEIFNQTYTIPVGNEIHGPILVNSTFKDGAPLQYSVSWWTQPLPEEALDAIRNSCLRLSTSTPESIEKTFYSNEYPAVAYGENGYSSPFLTTLDEFMEPSRGKQGLFLWGRGLKAVKVHTPVGSYFTEMSDKENNYRNGFEFKSRYNFSAELPTLMRESGLGLIVPKCVFSTLEEELEEILDVFPSLPCTNGHQNGVTPSVL